MRRADGKPLAKARRYEYGVTKRNKNKCWLVKFTRNKMTINVGSYADYNEACEAADKFLKEECAVPKYFTYVNGLRGPEPQIWYGSPVDGAGKPKASVMPPVALDDGDKRTIEELKLAYPIEATS